MSIALRTKLRSLSAAYLLRSLPSSIDCSSGISSGGGVSVGQKLEAAAATFRLMREKGTIPEVVLYTAVVEGFCKRLDDACVFAIGMLEAGHYPNLGTVTRLKVFDEMRAKGFFVEEKKVREYLHKNGPFVPSVFEAILGKKASKRGALTISIEGIKQPLIVEKSDGGFNYASTDLAALWYRLNEEKAEWIIYVTDVGQREHFELFFSVSFNVLLG
ncbi:hypothetical protein CASFOL_022944 [Castilleja foliolosa]|uniref:Arginyl-tRNA synthetase catalytic core domain-containing protein n=1 Tax=Castilleja foliolosa TaxID=1961234 RepID=A0ABD3CX66_9LAMI